MLIEQRGPEPLERSGLVPRRKDRRWRGGISARRQLDRRVAKTVARHTSPAVERPARLLTWAADEHVLYVIAGGLWLAARAGDDRERRQTDHLALSIVVTAILPHLLKRLIDQKRPDRCMVHGRRRGIPRSGKPYDAFPSGHAMHVGAVASAVSWAYPKSAPIAWGLGGLIAATRIVMLAHWTTDVLAGLAIGALVERCLRPLSKGAIRSDIEARQASVHARTAATNRVIQARHGTVMTLIVILLVTVLLLLMLKPTRVPVLVILGALLLIWLFAGH